jgi:hypothetical protein
MVHGLTKHYTEFIIFLAQKMLELRNIIKTRKYHARSHIFVLKGPKHEIFDIEFFTQIRPVWIGDLETGEKN